MGFWLSVPLDEEETKDLRCNIRVEWNFCRVFPLAWNRQQIVRKIRYEEGHRMIRVARYRSQLTFEVSFEVMIFESFNHGFSDDAAILKAIRS